MKSARIALRRSSPYSHSQRSFAALHRILCLSSRLDVTQHSHIVLKSAILFLGISIKTRFGQRRSTESARVTCNYHSVVQRTVLRGSRLTGHYCFHRGNEDITSKRCLFDVRVSRESPESAKCRRVCKRAYRAQSVVLSINVCRDIALHRVKVIDLRCR